MNLEFDFITPFYFGAKEVFEQLLKTTVNVSQINKIETNTTIDDITVKFDIKNEAFDGKVYYFMNKDFVLNILNIMIGNMIELDLESEMTKSALLELNNMITGKAITKLSDMGTEYKMSVPNIIIGKDISLGENPLSLSVVTLDSEKGAFTIGFLTSNVENIVRPGPKRADIDNKSLIEQFKNANIASLREISQLKTDNDSLIKKAEITLKLANNFLQAKNLPEYENSSETLNEIKNLLSVVLDELKVSRGNEDYTLKKNELISRLAKTVLDILLEFTN